PGQRPRQGSPGEVARGRAPRLAAALGRRGEAAEESERGVAATGRGLAKTPGPSALLWRFQAKVEDVAADVQLVAVTQWAAHLPAVDRRAVDAAEVLDDDLLPSSRPTRHN